MAELPVGTTTSKRLRFMTEGDGDHETVDVVVTERDWPVTDPGARARVATEVLGEIDDYYASNAQWFIDEKRNAAALCVYRPKTEAALDDWEKRTGWREWRPEEQAALVDKPGVGR